MAGREIFQPGGKVCFDSITQNQVNLQGKRTYVPQTALYPVKKLCYDSKADWKTEAEMRISVTFSHEDLCLRPEVCRYGKVWLLI